MKSVEDNAPDRVTYLPETNKFAITSAMAGLPVRRLDRPVTAESESDDDGEEQEESGNRFFGL